MNETTPMPTDAPNRWRMYAGSTSIPARKVRTIDAKAATNVSQSWLSKMQYVPCRHTESQLDQCDGHADFYGDHAREECECHEHRSEFDSVQPGLLTASAKTIR